MRSALARSKLFRASYLDVDFIRLVRVTAVHLRKWRPLRQKLHSCKKNNRTGLQQLGISWKCHCRSSKSHTEVDTWRKYQLVLRNERNWLKKTQFQWRRSQSRGESFHTYQNNILHNGWFDKSITAKCSILDNLLNVTENVTYYYFFYWTEFSSDT